MRKLKHLGTWLQPLDVIDDTVESADKFGWNYGGGVSYITVEQLEEFSKGGKLIAIEINGGEYSQFITLNKDK